MLLEIKNLTVQAADKVILKNCSLVLPQEGIQVIMGPNGSGKSTLCNVIMGHADYQVTKGAINFNNEDLLALSVDERGRRGIFLGFQHPREISGISLGNVMRAIMEARGQKIKSKDLFEKIKNQLEALNLNEEFLRRPLNEHASGGEKKRLEMAQLGIMAPRLAILDEIDSGLDIDSLEIIAKTIKKLSKENKIAFLIITHYSRLFRYLKPDKVHIMISGEIVKSGDRKLIAQLEKEGYKRFAKNEQNKK